MAFLVYTSTKENGSEYLVNTNEEFSLAGKNLIYKAWVKKGKPLNKGWHISAKELQDIYNEDEKNKDDVRFIIDWYPGSDSMIGLIEILDIYLFTYSADNAPQQEGWTPMMLKLRDVFYEEGKIDKETKQKKIQKFEPRDKESFIEFLYLIGNWNWGKNGMTNAVFISDKAREYFKPYF